MDKEHKSGLFAYGAKIQIRKKALVDMDMFFQAKPKGIGFPEVDFCIGGKRGSFDRKYDVVFNAGIQCIHRFPPVCVLAKQVQGA